MNNNNNNNNNNDNNNNNNDNNNNNSKGDNSLTDHFKQCICPEKLFYSSSNNIIYSNLSMSCYHYLNCIHSSTHKNNSHTYLYIFVGNHDLPFCTHHNLKQSRNIKI